MGERVLVAMSGGVDSSVAALKMLEQGCVCIGGTMKLFTPACAGCDPTCGSGADAEDAAAVCRALGMEHRVYDLSAAFGEEVIARFVDAYERGATPNPCIDCNRYMKFERLYRLARAEGYDLVATGHYARVEQDPVTGRWLLKKAADPAKDQSYVLYALTQEQLAHTRFPLGDMTKAEVRAMAAAHGFLNAEKRDSQDICFVPDGDYAAFISRYTGKTYPEGDFLDSEGRVIGTHRGIIRYTVGQRKGLGVALGEPMYVAAVDVEKNTVTLTREEALFRREVTVRGLNLIDCESLSEPRRVTAKIRYRHREQPAVAVQTGPDTLRLTFDEPQRAVTKGQAAVLYDGDTVVGGGTIIEEGHL